MTPMDLVNKNLYVYCDGNPINKIDCFGSFAIPITIGIMLVGGAVGAGISAVGSALTQKGFNGEINWKSVAIAAGSGFITGAIAASPVGLIGQIVTGMAVGGGAYVADSIVNDNKFDILDFSVSVAGGGISGRIGGAGANQNYALSNVIKVSSKTISRFAAKATLKYEAKRLSRELLWRNKTLCDSAIRTSIRFAAGIGVSAGLTAGTARYKSRIINFVTHFFK